MVVCFLNGLYLSAHPTVRLITSSLLYFTAYYFYYAYIYHIDAWWKLELSGLWGECYVGDLGVWRVRVVSTKLEYTMSLGQVLP